MTSATEALKEALNQVKVYKPGADDFERKLKHEVLGKWNEKCEVMRTTKIPSEKISKFFDHLKDTYEGIDDEVRKKLNNILFSEGETYDKIIETKFNTDNGMGARYGMIAIGQSSDQKYYDFMYALFKMDFEVAPRQVVAIHLKSTSHVGALFAWTTTTLTASVKEEKRKFTGEEIKTFKNFFRLKAMESLCEEGVCDKVNYAVNWGEI